MRHVARWMMFGTMLTACVEHGWDTATYLDPDIYVYRPLDGGAQFGHAADAGPGGSGGQPSEPTPTTPRPAAPYRDRRSDAPRLAELTAGLGIEHARSEFDVVRERHPPAMLSRLR